MEVHPLDSDIEENASEESKCKSNDGGYTAETEITL
jgi:hypothetical protein